VSLRTTSRTGLTLVEVLLAMVILATGAMVLMTAVSHCLAVIRISRNYHTARHIFDLGELEYPVFIKDEKVVNLELNQIEYKNGFTFSRNSIEDPAHKGMRIIHTRVDWSDRGNRRGEETVSYLYYTNDLSLN
jgi:prepilin-type N-terminal cleavage/methylation domain-containing protein